MPMPRQSQKYSDTNTQIDKLIQYFYLTPTITNHIKIKQFK
jgi:hypothetical protein